MKRRHHGFTLMEMLVTLIISALAVTLMFQALGSFNQARKRTAALEGVRDNQSVLTGWISDTIRGVQAIDPRSLAISEVGEPALGLSGDQDGFTAMTLYPLLGATGSPTIMHWHIRHAANGDVLTYTQNQHAPLHFAMDGALVFSYLDHEGKWKTSWPPRKGLQSPLPEAIRLRYTHDGKPRVLVAAVAAPQARVLAPYGPKAEQ